MEIEENQADSVQIEAPAPRPWGFWATIGFSCAIGVVSLGVCIVTGVGYVFASKARNPELDISEFARSMESSGTFLAIIAIELAIPTIGLVLLFSKIRKNITVREYLYIRRPGRNQLLKWSLVILLYAGIVEVFTFGLTFTGRPFMSEFMVNTYSNVSFKSILLHFIRFLSFCHSRNFYGLACTRNRDMSHTL